MLQHSIWAWHVHSDAAEAATEGGETQHLHLAPDPAALKAPRLSHTSEMVEGVDPLQAGPDTSHTTVNSLEDQLVRLPTFVALIQHRLGGTVGST